MSGRETTLELISQALTGKYGAAYAQRWLEKQAQPPAQVLVLATQAQTRTFPLLPGGTPNALSGPLKPHDAFSPTKTRISPTEAPKTALKRLKVEAEALAGELRERAAFFSLKLRCDRRLRLAQFHTQLVLYALSVAFERGYRKACTITVHTVMELVGFCLGIKSSSTLYSYLHTLKALGLIDFRGHVTTIAQEDASGESYSVNRCDGALLCVRLGGNRAPKLSRFDFAESPRDLQADIACGHTAYRLRRQLEESREQENKLVDVCTLVQWSLNPQTLFTPLKTDPLDSTQLIVSTYPTGIYDLMTSKDRNHDVDLTARMVAQLLRDGRSLNFYRKLLWQLLRAKDRGWDFSNELYNLLVRVIADTRERFARTPGALFASRLKKTSFWHELWRDGGQWVGGPVLS